MEPPTLDPGHACFDLKLLIGSPASGILTAALMLLVSDWYQRRQNRKHLLAALQTEAASGAEAVGTLLENLPSNNALDKLLTDAEAGQLTADTFLPIQAGWCFFRPSVSYQDVITKLSADESATAISYLDAWSRLVAHEERYHAVFHRLLDTADAPDTDIKKRELAVQLKGYVGSIRRAAERIIATGQAMCDLPTPSLWGSLKRLLRARLCS